MGWHFPLPDKEGYKHLFFCTVVTTTLATIVNIIMAHLGII